MRCPWIITLASVLLSHPVHAQQDTLNDMSCLELAEEVRQHDAEETARPDPVGRVFDEVLSDLEGDAYLRIASPFQTAFIRWCLQSADARQDETITVSGVIEQILDLFDLDPSAPKWGLIEIPELDVNIHTAQDIQQAIDTLGDDAFRNPVNNPVALALAKYFQKYDLSTQNAQEAAHRVAIYLTYEASEKPMAVTLDRLSKEEGLRLK